LFQNYRDRVEFMFVYIREAHPTDEWQVDSNEREGVLVAQPTSLGQRQQVARSCSDALQMTLPCVVDDMKNTADIAYAAWPERLYVIEPGGRIAYVSGQGPFGFKPGEVADWLRENVKPAM
jgi:hypothetical protein